MRAQVPSPSPSRTAHARARRLGSRLRAAHRAVVELSCEAGPAGTRIRDGRSEAHGTGASHAFVCDDRISRHPKECRRLSTQNANARAARRCTLAPSPRALGLRSRTQPSALLKHPLISTSPSCLSLPHRHRSLPRPARQPFSSLLSLTELGGTVGQTAIVRRRRPRRAVGALTDVARGRTRAPCGRLRSASSAC